jgi:hypothetical protein
MMTPRAEWEDTAVGCTRSGGQVGNVKRSSRRPTIYLGENVPTVVGNVFSRHGFPVFTIADDPILRGHDDEVLLASLYPGNGVLITRDELLYEVVARSRPHLQHAGIVIIPASYPSDQVSRLTHLLARWYRAATISSPFGGRNRLLYPGKDGLRVLDTTVDIGKRDQLSFPWSWWETNDDQAQA